MNSKVQGQLGGDERVGSLEHTYVDACTVCIPFT